MRSGRSVEEAAVKRLLWYFNAGGRRTYEITSAPDRGERPLKAPDRICIDKQSGLALAVEVTEIHGSPMHPAAIAYADQLSEALANELRDRLPAMSAIQVLFYVPIPRQRRPVQTTAKEAAVAIKEALEHAPSADTIELTRPCRMQVNRHKFLNGVACSHYLDLHLQSSDIGSIMERALREAAHKFAAYSDMRTILLFVSSPLFLLNEKALFAEAFAVLSSEVQASADRVYALTAGWRIIRLK